LSLARFAGWKGVMLSDKFWPSRLLHGRVDLDGNLLHKNVRVITKLRMLPVLGHPPPNAVKYYSCAVVDRLCADDAWLARISDAMVSAKWVKNHPGDGPDGAIRAAKAAEVKEKAKKAKKGVSL